MDASSPKLAFDAAAIMKFKVKSLFKQVLFCDDKTLEHVHFTDSYTLEALK